MLIRRAIPDDVYREDLRALVLRGLNSGIGLTHSWPKLESLAKMGLDNGFWMVAEEMGEAAAHILAIITPNPIFEGDQCIVIAWYSERPGAGWRLFNKFHEWVKTQNVTSVAISTNMDKRLNRILKKRGWILCPVYLKT